jgi:hypothetical protein
MSIFTLTPPLRLAITEDWGIILGGQTRPGLFDTCDEQGQLKEVVLKLRQPDAVFGDGHYAGTSLACELICAVLARAVGLNVPDYAIVDVTQDFAESLDDNPTRDLLLNNIGPNFGSVHDQSLYEWEAGDQVRSQVLIDQLEDILTFDAIVINIDRHASNTNLLYSHNLLVPIDHSLALSVRSWQQDMLVNPLPRLEINIREHCAGQLLKGKGCSYRRVFDRWQERIDAQKLEELRAMLPSSWEHQQGDIDKIFTFLKGRHRHFSDISTRLKEVLL